MQTEIQTHWSYCKNYVCFPVEDVVRVLSFLILFIVLFPGALDRPASRMFSGDSDNLRGFRS